MAKDIVILNITEGQGATSNVNCVFWFPVEKGFPAPSFLSNYVAINSDPNTAGMEAALQKGTLAEESHSYQFPAEYIRDSWDAVQVLILAFYEARKKYRELTLPESGLKYAILHDSETGWK